MFPFTLTSIRSVPTWLLSVVAGLLLGIGLLVSVLWWFTVFGVVLSLVVIPRAESAWRAAQYSLIIWWCKSLVVFLWVWDTYPLDWTGGASPVSQIALIVFFWLFTASLTSVGGGAFGYIAWRVFHIEYTVLYRWAILPFLWLIGEWCSSLAFSIGFAGAGATATPLFSFGFIGYVLAATPFGIWAAFTLGVSGLSAGVVLLGMVVYQLCSWYTATGKQYVLGGVVAIIAVVGWMPIAVSSRQAEPVHVAAVTTDFTSSLYVSEEGESQRYQALDAAVTAAVATNPGTVVLPEDSRFLQMMYSEQSPEQAGAAFRFTHGGTKATLVDSSEMVRLDDGSLVVRVSIADAESGSTYEFDKQYLVPIGEYVPYVLEFLMRLFGYEDALLAYQKNNSYTPGPYIQTADIPQHLPGVVFCFEEVMSGAVGRSQRVRPAPYYIHSISHSWIHESYIFEHQLDSMLQIHSRIARVPIITAANMTQSKLYLPNGDIETGELLGSGSLWRLHLFTF